MSKLNDNYIPFGPEWKAEMKKWTKDALIDFLAETCKKLNALKEPKP